MGAHRISDRFKRKKGFLHPKPPPLELLETVTSQAFAVSFAVTIRQTVELVQFGICIYEIQVKVKAFFFIKAA